MSHAPSDALRRRHQKVRAACASQHLDALVVTSLPNILYLTNFTGSAAIVVLTRDRLHFLTDSRYVTAVEAAQRSPSACPGLQLMTVAGAYETSLVALLRSMPEARGGLRIPGSEGWAKAIWSCWISAPSTTHTAST